MQAREEWVMNNLITALQKLIQHHLCGKTKQDKLSVLRNKEGEYKTIIKKHRVKEDKVCINRK